MTEDDYVSYNARLCALKYARGGMIGISIVMIPAIFAGERDAYALIPPVIGGAIVVALMWLWTLRRVKGVYRETKSMSELKTVEFNDEQFSIGQQSGTFKASWHDFNRWTLDSRALVLWLNSAMFILVPMRSLSVENLNVMKENLERTGLPMNTRRKKV